MDQSGSEAEREELPLEEFLEYTMGDTPKEFWQNKQFHEDDDTEPPAS